VQAQLTNPYQSPFVDFVRFFSEKSPKTGLFNKSIFKTVDNHLHFQAATFSLE
jgi:hypothetical protein